MSTNGRHPSLVNTAGRLPGLDSASGSTGRSAMIVTSAQTVRDGPPGPPPQKLENTYQLGPSKPASSSKLKQIIAETLAEQLTGRTYSSESAKFAVLLADQLTQRAKELGIPRYRFVSLVFLGSSARAAVSMASRCVWDKNTDTFAEHTYEKDGLYATAVIYGIYTE